MEYTHLPPPEHDPLGRSSEADSRLHELEERFHGLTFDELRSFCLEQEPTATVGILVLAERRWPADSNPEAKYLMLVELLSSLAALHEVGIEEEVRALEQAFNLPSATNPSTVPPSKLLGQRKIPQNEDATG